MGQQKSKFQADSHWAAHLSVGCVLLNDRQEVALHYHAKSPVGNDLYLLVRETINDDETLETAVHRGLMEEMGVTADIVAYLDSMRVVFDETLAPPDYPMNKTTVYFLTRLIQLDESKRAVGDLEAKSKIVWKTLDETRTVFAAQALRMPDRPDLHEADVIEWAQNYLKKS